MIGLRAWACNAEFWLQCLLGVCQVVVYYRADSENRAFFFRLNLGVDAYIYI